MEPKETHVAFKFLKSIYIMKVRKTCMLVYLIWNIVECIYFIQMKRNKVAPFITMKEKVCKYHLDSAKHQEWFKAIVHNDSHCIKEILDEAR